MDPATQKEIKDLIILPRSFYAAPTIEVARALLGKFLIFWQAEGAVGGEIVECEAYLGENDPGSHASIRKTPRNSIMFGATGKAYVYFIYGKNYCLNAVAHDGGPGAVLLRAIRPIWGLEVMEKRRKCSALGNLTGGPGKLCHALGITKVNNGWDLVESPLQIMGNKNDLSAREFIATPRIGLSRGEALKLRFILKDNPIIKK